MAKNTIADLDTTASNNTDVLNQSTQGTAAVSTIDTMIHNSLALLARFYADLGGLGTVGGTADAITLTTASTYQALESGLTLAFKAGSANTGAATINVDSLGAKAIRRLGDSALSAGDIAANGVYLLRYDTAYNGAAGAWILINGGGVTAASNAEVLAGTSTVLSVNPNNLRYVANVGRNFAYNPQGEISIRTGGDGNPVSIADNGYCVDRWRWIGEASASVARYNATSVSQNGAHGIANSQVIGFMTSNNKGGYWQVLPFRDAKALRGQTVAFSAALYVNDARVGDVRMGIAEFTGTADATTGDPISAWGAAGTNPTLAANWTFLNTPSNLGVAPSGVGIAKFTVTATVGASANNLALMIWCNDKTYNTNDYFSWSQVQLCVGSETPFFVPQDENFERDRCLEFAWKSFARDTVPAQNVGVNTGELHAIIVAAGASQGLFSVRHPRRMYKTPTATLYNPAAVNAQARDEQINADCSSTTASLTDSELKITFTGNASSAAGYIAGVHALVEAEI